MSARTSRQRTIQVLGVIMRSVAFLDLRALEAIVAGEDDPDFVYRAEAAKLLEIRRLLDAGGSLADERPPARHHLGLRFERGGG